MQTQSKLSEVVNWLQAVSYVLTFLAMICGGSWFMFALTKDVTDLKTASMSQTVAINELNGKVDVLTKAFGLPTAKSTAMIEKK